MKKFLLPGKLLATLWLILSSFSAASAQTLASSGEAGPTAPPTGAQQSRSLKEILSDLESRYQISFSYDRLTVENKAVKPPRQKFSSVEEELTQLLKPLDLGFEKLGENLYLILPAPGKPAPRSSVPEPKSPAPAALAPVNISGTVRDEAGSGLPGVTVLVKGTTVGSSTNPEGKYSIAVPEPNAAGTLVFSSIGYTTEEVPISGRTTIDVTLLSDVKSLQEVVVIGYGTQKKRDLTGAISSISPEKINQLPISRVEQALQGRISGVNVTSNSGAPGGSVAVRIRGIGTINNNQPLYVIDGIPVFGDGALNSINANDIASIEVLKDASATAIYGARAANGVVIVTTKRGKEGRVSLTYDGYTGLQQLARQYDMLNATQWALLSNEMRSAQRTDPLTPEWGDPANIPGGVDTDWQKEIFRSAFMQNHALSLSGGGENSQYLVSGSYFDQDGAVKGSNFKRYSIRANTDANIFGRVKLGTSLLFSRTMENSTGNGGRIETALRQLPTVPVKFADGTWGGPQGAKEYYNDQSNPVAEIELFSNRLDRNRFLGNLFGEVELLKGLAFRSSYSADLSMLEEKGFIPTYQFGVLFRNTAGLTQVNARNITQILENSLSYNRTFSGQHNLSAVVVYSAQVSESNSESASANGLISNALPYLNVNTGLVTINNGDTYANEWSLLSYTGRLNYTFADKYLFSATVRRDGSSRFSRSNRYATFPAFSVGWRLSDEGFMKGIRFINELKLRGSWGRSGNQEIGLYPYFANLAIDRRYVFGPGGAGQTIVPGVAPVSLANPDLKWETATQTNVGLDAGLLNNQLSLSANYFIKKTTDMLVRVPIPQTSGIASAPFVNGGSLENRGVELELNFRKTAGALTYELGGNLSTVTNKVLSLGGGRPIFGGEFRQPPTAGAGKM